MKKLNKLQINSEKIMKNEELLALRGGYDGWLIICFYPFGGTCETYGNCIGDVMTWCHIGCPGTNRAIC